MEPDPRRVGAHCSATLAAMVEVIGDSARGAKSSRSSGSPSTASASSRRTRPGSSAELEGLTLLEAAAVGGETLAVDALANALAQVFRAEPHPERVAVAMSGGVDSAVALLRAGPHALGVTLRLWMDPAGPRRRARVLLAERRDRGARDVPSRSGCRT